MAIEEGSGIVEETAVERNARLQAAFNAASSSLPSTSPNMPRTNAPEMPTQEQSIFGENIDLSPGAQIGLSFADTPLGQTPYQDERQYNLQRFDPTPASSQVGMPQALAQQGQIPFAFMRDAASYTSQSLFGGYDVRTQGFFEGAYDRDGNLINPDLRPNMLTPELAELMWPYASEAVRISLGYNPEAPYELQEPVDPGGGGGDGGGGDGGGSSIGGQPSSMGTGTPRFSGWGLTMWRIT